MELLWAYPPNAFEKNLEEELWFFLMPSYQVMAYSYVFSLSVPNFSDVMLFDIISGVPF